MRSLLCALALVALAAPVSAQPVINPEVLKRVPPAGPLPQLPPPAPARPCMTAPADIADGVYAIRLASTGRALDSENGGTYRNGAGVIAWDWRGGDNQKWLISRNDDGTYMLRSAKTAKAVQGNVLCRRPDCNVSTTMANARNVMMKFSIEAVSGGGYRLRIRDEYQLGFLGGGSANGQPARMMDIGCGADQVFRIERLGDFREVSRADGVGRLMNLNVRLNNYTARRHEFDGSGERAYFKPRDAWIEFGIGGRPLRSSVQLPVLEVGPDRMFKVYVNDLNSSGMSITAQEGRLKFAVNFEDSGVEIITNCYNNANCHVGEPRFDLSDTSLTVFLQPQFDAGRNTWGFSNETQFAATINESGPCINNFWAFLCTLFLPDRDSIVRSSVINVVNNQLGFDRNGNPGAGRIGLEAVLNSIAGGTSLRRVAIGDRGEMIFH